MMQNVRMKNLEKFTHSKSAVLFCTDIGARGLDIPKVDLVIHYHIPTRTDIFVHRSGRTARANQSGKVSSLISGKELGLYRRTMIDLNYKQFSMNTLPVGQLEKIKSLFEYARELERDNYKYVKENREKMWYKNAAKQCDMIYDDYGENREDELDDEEDRREKEQEKKLLNKKRKIESKIKFQRKKIYTKLNENNIKRSSFLSPDQVDKLNSLMKDDNFKNQNITQALFEAKKDMRSLRPRYKPKQRRYMKRRRGH
jgi:ATP-dependent RNA helicase DDX24/MAK5